MRVPKADGRMGFRDFQSFNKALLAKQCWRLWHMPNSLLSQIMEAKYHPGGNILDAQLGTRPSHAWRSILSSCDLIKEGLVWRIGNGNQVRIWKDFLVQPKPNLLDENAKVCELIDPDSKWWGVSLSAETIFIKEDVELILSIPVSVSNLPNARA